MKYKYFFGFLLLTVAIIFIHKYNSKNKDIANWETFEKTKDQKINYRKTTKLELKKINGTKRKKRAPAAISTKRLIIGDNQKDIQEYINAPSKDWKEKLGHELLNHRLPGTKVFIKEVQSNIIRVNGKGRYVEKVVVTTIATDGKQYSFNALADSETGEVITTWNKTHHENFGARASTGMSATAIY